MARKETELMPRTGRKLQGGKDWIVTMPPTDAYRSGWDLVFGKKEKPKEDKDNG